MMGTDDLTEFRLNDLTHRIEALEARPTYAREMEEFKAYKGKAVTGVLFLAAYIFKEPFLRLMAYLGFGHGN